MHTMATAFNVPVGYSDHTTGIDIPAAAVALGACVIEKHFTVDRSLPGPDHSASLEPRELRQMIQSIRRIESALGDGVKAMTPNEIDTARVARRSLTAAVAMSAGTRITERMIAVKRPGTGLAPSMMKFVVGRIVRGNVTEGALLQLEMLD